MYGWKGKIGLLVPAGNRVILPEFYRVAPPGIAFFETRMIVQGSWISEEANFSMIRNASASPWTPDISNRAVEYLEESGFEVVNACSEPIDRIRVNDQLPEFAYSFAVKADV